MSLARQALFWFGALIAFIFFLVLFEGILLPFVAGAFIAYLLNPIARRLQRLGLGRTLSALVILIAFVVLVVATLLLIVPALVNQAINFIDRLPAYVMQLQNFITTYGDGGPLARLIDVDANRLQVEIQNLIAQGSRYLGGILQSIWLGGQAVVQALALFVLTPVIAFYLLVDWDRMISSIEAYLPRDHAGTIHALAQEMDRNVSGFIHGQLTVGLLLGVFYATALLIVGLNHGLLIGLGAGLVSFVPYLGSTLGFVVSAGVALNQFWPDYVSIGAVLVIFLVGQFVEGNVLQPRMVGNRVGLHPVWLIFALLAFGSLFGFAGVLIAVPAAAAVGVLLRFALVRYRASSLYSGKQRSAPRVQP